ncbi:MAG: carbohydrate kinase family protein [Chloroflexi bacterium]|jgi:ribokinase|nr:carbohydrate kinase family protein [Anaerolineaceae bacterium]NMB87964.1 carbohydrate kinase family protein [Chloroflexota bacterium]
MQTNAGGVMPEFTLPPGLRARPVDVLALGSVLQEQILHLDKWPVPGGQDVVTVDSVTFSPGGCAMNVATFTGRAGGRAALLSAIGDGRFGTQAYAELAAARVDITYLKQFPGKAGNLIILLSDPAGDWVSMDAIDPDITFDAGDLPPAGFFETVKFLHIDGFSYLNVCSPETVWTALQRARRAGCLISVDGSVPAARSRPDFMARLFREADIVFANQAEACAVTHSDDVDQAAARLLELGPQAAIVKLGAQGSRVLASNAGLTLPAYPVEVRDTIAAGDAYVAHTLLALCQGLPLMAAAQRGSAAGALACLGHGSLSTHFGLPEVLALIERSGP